MLFTNFLCLLYLMVLADSHTISKSIDSDEKVDDIFESINDVDQPTIPKTRKDRHHKYKVYYSKDHDELQGIKETKPYSEVYKPTNKISVKATTENAKRHKPPKRRVVSFWKKLRGKDKKKETETNDSKERKRRISFNHKKDSHKIAHVTTTPDPGTKAKKNHRKKLLLRQHEHKVSKRDASGLFSTRPYSNTPQSYKLQMGIAPQVDNMLKSKKCKIKPVQPHAMAMASGGATEVPDNLQSQLDRVNSNLSKLKEKYGLAGNKVESASYNNPSATSPQENTEPIESIYSDYQGTAEIDGMLSAMREKAVIMMSSQKASQTSKSSATVDSHQPSSPSPGSEFSALVTGNEKTTVTRTSTYALNPEDSTINANTESHYLAARSIKEDAMTIAMNVEDLLQKELKNLYNKVKHKVSNDFRKEVHTAKSTIKDGYDKLSSKVTTSKPSNITSSKGPCSSTAPPKHSTTPFKHAPPKIKEKPAHVSSPITPNTVTTTITTTTAPRVKKKDEKEDFGVEDTYTPETYGKQTYDDYVMLTLYEQMLAKTHEENIRKLLAKPESLIHAKKKRDGRRLSKRNPETLTDVKLTEVVRNIYDDGGNMPDYDYIDPAANVSSTGPTTGGSNNYNDADYVINDSSGSADFNSQGSTPFENKLEGTSPVPKEDGNAGDAVNNIRDSDNSATVAYNPAPAENPASEPSYEGLSDKISYNQYVDGYKHYLKFQQDLKNQNFSNLIKYQAHRHHSVDDIGKYILNKIPPLPTLNRRKRSLRFSDESDNNMDYQEITTKSDDSWFRKHFYMFIDNGPPKKYHTSETVELKPGSVNLKLYITDTTPTTRNKEQILIRIDDKNTPRKTKDIQDISLDDLSKILDSVKDKETNYPLKKESLKDVFISLDTYNATDDVKLQDSSFIGKFLGGKRRQESKQSPVSTVYFPTTNYMYDDNSQTRFKRTTTKESFENTLMSDFINKVNLEEKAATTGTKEVNAVAAQTSNRETNKYGYVDIDLVPRQTAVVKLRNNTKKSRIKNFFKKFYFKKDKTKKSKPKRSAYYNYYSAYPRKERFNPLKRLKDMFKPKEGGKEKDFSAPARFRTMDYDVDSEHIGFDKPKLEKALSVAEMQRQIPNITDTKFEHFAIKHTTKEISFYKLDEKDQDLLYNYHLSSSSAKPLLTSAKQPMLTTPVMPAKEATVATPLTSLMASTISKTTATPLLRVPPCNVMTVNVKTMDPKTKTSRKVSTERTSLPMAIEDMSVLIEQMQKDLKTTTKHYPTISTIMFNNDITFDVQTEKYYYKKNVPSQMSDLPKELSIKSKLTRFGKFPIRQRRYKMRRGNDDSEPDDVESENLGIDGSSVLRYIPDFESRNAVTSGKRKSAVKRVHPQKPFEKKKSVYTDYFNDLLMWHNDILNLDSVPNPVWVKILKTLQTDTAHSYTTPEIKNLMVDWNEMNDFLGTLTNSAVSVFPNASMEVKAKARVGLRVPKNQLDKDEGLIRSVAMNDNTLVTSKDILIKGEAKYFQYNKPKSPDTLASCHFVKKLDNLNKIGDDKSETKMVLSKRKVSGTREPGTPADDVPADEPIIVDTTIMAYDDDVDSITKELGFKLSKVRNCQKSGKAPSPVAKQQHTSVLKTNKAPVQYYTTPLPMKSQDFQKFLQDHEMSVEYVTAPIIELPTLIDSWTTNKKDSKYSKENNLTPSPGKTPIKCNKAFTTTTAETIESTTGTKSTQPSTDIEVVSSKLENITKTGGKIAKYTTERQKGKAKVVNGGNLTKKISFWSEDFDRYKRFNALKLPPSAATTNVKATHEPKYYGIFKKKVKDKLFDKKVDAERNHPTTEAYTIDPHNKEVEITIINFDDLEKMSTQQPFDSFVSPKKEETHLFTDFNDMVPTDTMLKLKMKTNTQRGDHNELLYKDIFNERTSTREYLAADLTKRTEYMDQQTLLPQFEKAPMYSNIFNKMPHRKYNMPPKRVHITSHHYKYDIFYDENKKRIGKNNGIEGLLLQHLPVTSTSMKLPQKRASTSEEESNNAAVNRKINGGINRNRHRRRVWATETPHTKRKHFTYRGYKPKSSGGLVEPIGYFETPVLTSTPDYSADVSMSQLKKTFTAASLENTGTINLINKINPLTDIEDLVTMLEGQDLGVSNSDIESAVTLAAIRTEFFTSITIGDSIRRELARAKPTAINVTVSTTTPATTSATMTTTTPATPKVLSSPMPSSLVYNIKQLQKTTSSNKSSQHKEKQQHHQRDRHRRLFRFSALQSRLKNLMKNLTLTSKHVNVTTPVTATSKTLISKPKRTCIEFISDPTNATKCATEKTTSMEAIEEAIMDGREGFCIHIKCKTKSTKTTTPTATTTTVAATATSAHPAHDPNGVHYEEDPPAFDYEITQHAPPTTTPRHHQHHCTHHVKGCIHVKPFPKDPEEVLYVEPQTYDEQFYEETVQAIPPSIPTPCEPEQEETTTHCDYKREVQPNTFTAKDVAALEVIVDLLKNTVNYEDNNMAFGYHQNAAQPSATKPNISNYSTNAIQVHIAIPYDFENGKKRSPPGPGSVRVRKVFSAIMSTPVDLEYQVHSIEGTIAPTATKPTGANSITKVDSLTSGMYLLIDKPKEGYALKPLLGQINLSDLKSRQLPVTTASMTELKPTDSRDETTSLKSLPRVTLSKEFVAAINQQLLELYENSSRVLDRKNKRMAVWRFRKLKQKQERKKKGVEKYIVKRRIDWEAVKKYFGHDRVCNCKCKSNTAMCRACAASDAVIDELIFEFDNIGRYMADHCTEIQTFFWMNPIGGQKLRDSVNKIDKSLSDYCKRVKGKCNGRLCKTFSRYVDKKSFVKTAKIKKVEDISCLVHDIAILEHDLNMTVALNCCYKDKLKDNGQKFINLMNTCINYKTMKKRSNPTTKPKNMVKQVYSLDNINVNIICNPESPSTADEQMIVATIAPQASSQQIHETRNDRLLDFEDEHKKHKVFINFIPHKKKKSKLLSYFDFNKKHDKRQVDNQASMPLISDGGGAFWYDYLKTGTNEPRLVRDSIIEAPSITVDVVQRAGMLKSTAATAVNNNLEIDTASMTVPTKPERNPRDTETTIDSLSRNINQMLQLFGSLQDVESMNNISTTNSNLTTSSPIIASIHKKVSKDKPKKVSLVDKVKQRVNAKKNRTTTTTSKTKKNTQKNKTELEKEMDELSTIEHTIEAVTQPVTTKNAITDISSVKVVEISSKITTCTPATNKTSPTVTLARKSTPTNNTAASTTVAIKGIAPKGDKKSESTKIVSGTKFGFKNIMHAATVMFKKPQKTQTPKTTTEISTTTEKTAESSTMSEFIDLVTSTPDNDYVIDDENAQNTTENPSILIINDYGNQVSNYSMNDDMKEGYNNLLLSIIQFEERNLNDEWDRIAYGEQSHRDDTDIKRSIPRTPKPETKTSKKLSTAKTTTSEEEIYLEPEINTTKASVGRLLNKIANKMGIKTDPPNTKKVVKKPKIRQVRKDSKRANFIRNRKLRINTYTRQTPAPVVPEKEASHTRRTTQPAQLCDIQATFKHIQNLQKSVPPNVFEILMKNVSCYKYRNADASFIIPYEKRRRTWDWIRNKRSLKHFHNKIKDDHVDDTYVMDFEDDSSDVFERFVKGDNGIYKIVNRKKRKANLDVLERGLRNIPPLTPTKDELFVMVGDSVTLDCGINAPVRTCDGKFHWQTDRKIMLGEDNVDVDGLTIAIHDVEPKNSGIYTCSLVALLSGQYPAGLNLQIEATNHDFLQDHTVRKNVRLNVLTVPSYDIVFLPVYKTEDNCSYEDLMAIQRLGSLMANETHCGKTCSIRIDEPVCQKDRSTNNTLVRATAVISMTPRAVNCSLQCKRDIVSSLVILCATNAAILSSIRVEVSREGVRETLTPWTDMVRPVVTHTLRKKDTNGHHEYHTLSSIMSPGKVDVVLICPAGYYLLPKYKLCSSCPPNTSSKAGDNKCRSCPRGTHADPGASTCHLVKTRHHRRYDWWWYPPCGYVVACCGVLFGCTACVLLSVIVHVVSGHDELREHDGDDEEQKIREQFLSAKPMPSVTVAYAHFPGARPLSPSRVILPRFFRPSLTSSRATDSQETKFELWKERNRPPPLPPIDFEFDS